MDKMTQTSGRRDEVVPAVGQLSGALAAGMAVVREHLKTLPASSGVYRMLNVRGEALYVGKAHNLKRRVTTYSNPSKLSIRLQRMVTETTAMEFVTTHTEVEALLLESNLIKTLKPRYNVLFRDDKSFPHIFITEEHDFPQVSKHRGARNKRGRYFGPFASAGAVNRTLTALQRAFLLRNCSDAVFTSRTRPCLQYQIKRCSAPCVGRIGKADYAALTAQAYSFLEGRSHEVQATLARQMDAASSSLEFETAAAVRDRIRALAHVQARQDINITGIKDADVIAVYQRGGHSCVQAFIFRGGCNFGNHAYFPSHDRNIGPEDVLGAFLGQFYENKAPPPLVLVSHEPTEWQLIADALSLRADRKVVVAVPKRGVKRKPIDHASTNARAALARRLAESASQRKLLEELAAALRLEAPPERIEVYDNSHIQGSDAVGAMIVAGAEGFMKSAYRKFTIRSLGGDSGPTAGDDYAMVREVLTRRFQRALKEDPDRGEGMWPDLVIIDGGKGQLSIAEQVLTDLGIDDVALLGIAKGPDRNAGRERLYMSKRTGFSLDRRDPVLYFLQRLRDEAHRFAIGTHRARRSKGLTRSPLDEVPGIGAVRKRALLQHFGSARTVSRAGLADLEAVDGVSTTVARKIYNFFHEDG